MFDFRNARPNVQSGGIGVTFERAGVGRYMFPDAIGAYGGEASELGRTFSLQIDPKAADLTVIGYNWKSAAYDVIRYR